jgi:sugar phosphate permease
VSSPSPLPLAIWFLVRNTPQEMGLPVVNEPTPGSDQDRPAIGLRQGMKMVLSSGPFWILATWFFFTCGIFFSFGGLWGGPYLMQVYGYSKAEAGNILGMLALAMVVGSPLLSWLSDRVLRSRKKVLLLSSVVTLGVSLPLAFWTADLNRPLLYGLCFLMGMFSSAIVAVAFTAARELFPLEIAGTAVGLVNLFPFLGGAVVPPVLGAILEAGGKTASGYSPQAYASAFLLYVVFAFIALVAAACVRETMEKPPSGKT